MLMPRRLLKKLILYLQLEYYYYVRIRNVDNGGNFTAITAIRLASVSDDDACLYYRHCVYIMYV